MAVSGALKGAAVGGAIAGPIGAGVGGVIGSGALDSVGRGIKGIGSSIWNGIAGSIGGQNSYQSQYAPLDQTQANQSFDQGQGARRAQQYLLNQLDTQLQGQGPTVAGIQAQQGIADAQRNAATQANNVRGTSRALAQRTAAYAGMQGAEQANRDAALLRAQEQLSAQQQFGTQTGAIRTGDTQDRQLSLDAAKANQSSRDTVSGQNATLSDSNATRAQKGTGAVLSAVGGAISGFLSDENTKEAIQPLMGTEPIKPPVPKDAPPADKVDSHADFIEKLRASLTPEPSQSQQAPEGLLVLDSANAAHSAESAALQRANAQAMNSDAGMSKPSQNSGGPPGIGGAIGGGMQSMGNGLMSDERTKENLDPITPYSYRYKPEIAAAMAEQVASRAPSGDRVPLALATYEDARAPREGVMAQDLLKSPEGKRVVEKRGGLLSLDGKRALSFALAQQAGLNRRLERIEGAIR